MQCVAEEDLCQPAFTWRLIPCREAGLRGRGLRRGDEVSKNQLHVHPPNESSILTRDLKPWSISAHHVLVVDVQRRRCSKQERLGHLNLDRESPLPAMLGVSKQIESNSGIGFILGKNDTPEIQRLEPGNVDGVSPSPVHLRNSKGSPIFR